MYNNTLYWWLKHEKLICTIDNSPIPFFMIYIYLFVNALRPEQNGHHFADDNFECIFMNEKVWMSVQISLKFISNGPIAWWENGRR